MKAELVIDESEAFIKALSIALKDLFKEGRLKVKLNVFKSRMKLTFIGDPVVIRSALNAALRIIQNAFMLKG